MNLTNMKTTSTTAAAALFLKAARTIIKVSDITITVIARPSNPNDAYSDLKECMKKREITQLLEKAEKNVWLWADIEIIAEYESPSGQQYSESEYLGCSSYNSRSNFIQTSGYYDDLRASLISQIREQVLTDALNPNR